MANFGAVLFFQDKIKPGLDPYVQYSDFVINQLHKHVLTDYMLIIQWDGYILNPAAWTDDFLKYDYIGAAWDYSNPEDVGNGGFSLRSTKLMRAISQLNLAPSQCMPEDWVICKTHRKYLLKLGFKFAPVELAHRFSVETNSHHPDIKYEGQFGFHNIYTQGLNLK